jgi:hypothetical protein
VEYDADGFFWIDDPDHAVRGHLSFTQDDGGRLRLEQVLLGDEGPVMQEIPLVHGRALDRTPLCLLDTFPTRIKIASPEASVHPQLQLVNSLLVGVEDPDEPFEKIRLAVHGLLDFTNQSGLRVAGEHQSSDQSVSVAWEPEPALPTATIDGVEIEIVSEHRFRSADYEFCLEHTAEIELRGSRRPIKDWSAHAELVEPFLTFFLGYPAWIERFYVPIQEGDVEQIVARRQTAAPGSKRGPWVPLPVIVDRFERALTGWSAFAASDEDACRILREYLLAGNRLLLEDQLLYLARVIELYHRGRQRFDQVVIPKSEHRARKKEIINACPKEHREWLNDALAHSNEKALQNRITELVATFGPALEPIVGRDVEVFAAQATDNRNYFTHYSRRYKDEGRVAEGIDLYRLVRRLLFVVRACVLREMGFENDTISKLLAGDREYDWLSAAP